MTEIDHNQKNLDALTSYIAHIVELFPDWEKEENPVVLVLACFRMSLERRIAKRLPTVQWNNVMRWAAAECHKLLDTIYDIEFDAVDNWNPLTELPSNPIQNLAAVLMTAQHELLGDIGEYLRTELKMSAETYAKELIHQFETAQ